jgi:hypothetical protein
MRLTQEIGGTWSAVLGFSKTVVEWWNVEFHIQITRWCYKQKSNERQTAHQTSINNSTCSQHTTESLSKVINAVSQNTNFQMESSA